MTRFMLLLVFATLLAPAALAAPDVPVEDANGVPALQAAGETARRAGVALAEGAASAGSATASVTASLVGGVAAALSAVGAGMVALGKLAGGAIAAIGRVLGGALTAIASGAASLGAPVSGLALRGAQQVASHPKESAIVAGSASGALTLAWLAKRLSSLLFVPLYTRLAPSEMLDNKVRSAVYEHVKAHPGAHPSAIAAALDIGWGTVVYHLSRLEESSLVTSRSARHRKCYFAVGSELDVEGRTAVAAMSTDKARAIVDALRGEPGLSQKDLAERLGMSQALASWHVKRLVTSGVLVSTRSGRSNLLHVAEHVPVMAAAVPLAA